MAYKPVRAVLADRVVPFLLDSDSLRKKGVYRCGPQKQPVSKSRYDHCGDLIGLRYSDRPSVTLVEPCKDEFC